MKDYIRIFKEFKNGLDYSKSIYINYTTKILITCSTHGEFYQTPKLHIKDPICPQCRRNDRVKLFNQEVWTKCQQIHPEYTYPNQFFKSLKDRIKVICPQHGEFTQLLSNHIYMKNKCLKCKHEKSRIGRIDYIDRCNLIHHYKYDYSNLPESFVIDSYIEIVCPIHNKFKQKASWHLNNGNGCKKCKSSKGELEIIKYLDSKGIEYQQYYKFSSCRNVKPLEFDFYLTRLNILIEFNGIQHYQPVKIFGGDIRLHKQINNDKLKVEFCQEKNLKLIVIKYDESIKEILDRAI